MKSIKIHESLLSYFYNEMGLQNESKEFRSVKIHEFKKIVEDALKAGNNSFEIIWIKN